MPGNRTIYDRAMEQYHDAARQRDWPRALKEGARALQEFPRESEARVAVATGLFHNDKLPQALQLFEELREADRQNPVLIEYLSKIKHKQGNTDDAIALLIEASELHQGRNLANKAIEALRDALELNERHEEARIRLASLLLEVNDRRGAIVEFMFLARQFVDAGDLEGAQEAINEILNLDSAHKEALQLQSQLQLLQQPPAVEEEPLPASGAPRGTGPLRSPAQIDSVMALAADLQARGDMRGAILQYERVLEVAPTRADAAYSLGLLYAEVDDADHAIAVLERAAGDPEYALSSNYALGNIYQATGKLELAAEAYEQTLRLLDLQAIGKDEAPDLIAMYEAAAGVYEEMGDTARAASLYSTLAAFLQTKRWGRDQADTFNKRAKELTERSMFSKLRLLGTGMLTTPAEPEPEPAQLETIGWGIDRIPSITDFLNPKQVVQEEDPLVAAAQAVEVQDPLGSLENLPEPQPSEFPPVTVLDTAGASELVERYVAASSRFIEQGLFYAALDACHEIIRNDLEYIPIHLRLGEIYERMGRREDALLKYQTLLETYEARGDNARAIDVHLRLIDLSPDSTGSRTRLADQLRDAGRNDEAAAQLAIVANMHYRMGQSNKALEEFRRLVQWAPDNREMRAQFGQLLIKLERWEAALTEFRRVVELDPENPVGLAQLNIALALSGEYPSAVWDSLATVLDKLKARPNLLGPVIGEYQTTLMTADRALIHYLIGIVQQSVGNHPSALLALEQALGLLEVEPEPMLPDMLVRQAMASSYTADGQTERAIEELRRCEAILATGSAPAAQSTHRFAKPFTAGELQRQLAEAYAEAGDLVGATSALQEVKRLLPYDRIAYTKLAEVYFRQGRLQEALAQFDELASYYEGQQQLDKAIETLESGVKLAPSNIPVRKRLAHMYIRRGFLDQGIEALGELAELQRAQGQIKDAVQSLDAAADVHWTLGSHDKCYAIFDRMLQIAPNDIEVRTKLANYYILSFNIDKAVEEQKRIAKICVQQRNYQEAIGALHGAIALAPNDANALEQLAELLMRVQEYAQALRIYQRLQKLKPGDERVEALIAAAQRMLDQQQHPSN